MIKGSGVIKNTLLRLDLSYSESDNNFKSEVNRGMTLGSVRTEPLRFVDIILLLIGHSCKARKGHWHEIASFFAIPN